jgi:hypothetical protein
MGKDTTNGLKNLNFIARTSRKIRAFPDAIEP